MKAITLHQPWAHLMAKGAKRIETRGRRCNIRGWVLIHAARQWTKAQQVMVADWDAEVLKGFATGALVCAVRIVDCVPTDTLRCVNPHPDPKDTRKVVGAVEWIYGDYTPGRFAWVTDAVVRFETPVLWKGRQGWFDVPDRVCGYPHHFDAGECAGQAKGGV